MASPPLFKDTKYIPLDYVRGEVIQINPDDLMNYLQNKWHERYFHTHFKGDEISKTIFQYKNMKLSFYPSGRLVIGGSLHKYHNHGKHNFDQYDKQAFEATIKRLEIDTSIRPENIRITGLEYGVNITPPISTNEILNRCFQHRGIDIEEVISRRDGKYHRAKHDAYELKLYNKGIQYNQRKEVFRIEIKTTNWSKYRRNGTLTLHNFIECDKTPFVQNLVDRWNETLFSDPTTTYNDQWHKYTNREYWRELRSGSRTNFHRHWHQMKKKAEESGANVQVDISNLILETITQLQTGTNTTFI